jgi:nucleoside phosphorylase
VANASYTSSGGVHTGQFSTAQQTRLPVNARHLPAATRTPAIVDHAGSGPVAVLTTDCFAFDDAADHYGLRSYEPDARAVEMDDAACALACHDFGVQAPPWVSVRKSSDPQMTGGDLATEKKQAAAIYEKYGYWTTVCSAIAVWALIADLPASQHS